MSTEINVNRALVELSAQELEEVAGGVDIFLSGSTFEKSDVFFAQTTSSNPTGAETSSVFKSSHTFSSAFQCIGLGFDSFGDVMNSFKGLAGLFGRRF